MDTEGYVDDRFAEARQASERAGTIRSPIAGRTVAICNALYCGAKSYTRLHRGRGWTHPHYMRMKD